MIAVSVCVIAYQHKNYLTQCLDSIVNQHFDLEFEVCLCDDNSTDGTKAICEHYAAQYPNLIKYTPQQSNLGMQGNWLRALRVAKGKYISICEGDDYWTDSRKIQKQYDFLEAHPEYVFCCGHAEIESDDKSLNGKLVHPEINKDQELDKMDFSTNSPLVTCTSFFRNIGFAQWPNSFSEGKAIDWFLWMYLLKNTNLKGCYLNQKFGIYRIHATGVFSRMTEIQKHRSYVTNLKILKAWESEPALQASTTTALYWHSTEIFRKQLLGGEKWNSFIELLRILRLGIGTKKWLKLLDEWKRN